MTTDFYAILEVSKSASQDEIQKSYRRLARKYHPDLNPDDESAKKKFKEIQHAHDVLSDPEKRKKYDQFGPDYERVQQSGGGYGFDDIFGGGAGPGGYQFEGDLGDIFRQFAGGGGGGGRSRGRRPQPQKGPDLTADLTIPFNTAVLGGEASISVYRGGKHESIQVKVPPGIDSGGKLRLRGQGEQGQAGNGDLIVTVRVAAHPFFRRFGNDLELKLPITIGEAMLGTVIDIPTPGGTVALRIPAGTSGGAKLRVKGQGVLNSSGPPGDLYVRIEIKVPTNSSDAQDIPDQTKQAIEHLDALYDAGLRDKIIW